MILSHITNKQKEILLLLYRFRFLNRIHIQKLLHHKSPKNINIWLQDLTQKQYTGRIYNKTREGMIIPAKYFISKNGIRFLKTQEKCEKLYLKKLYQENRRSESFIEKCLLIGDVYLHLRETIQNPTFKFYTPTDFPAKGTIQDLKPSFAYVFKKKKHTEHYACEILEQGMPRFAIRARVKQYIEFFAEDEGTHLIFVCPNDQMYQYVKRFIRRYLEEEYVENKRLYFHVTIREDIKQNNLGEEITPS